MAGSGGWESFAVMTGGASGALTGLLFVAVSLNADRIARHPQLRAIAAQTLVLFLAPLVMATVLLAPRQPHWVLGAELITVGLCGGLSLLAIGRRTHGPSTDERLTGLFDRRDSSIVVMLLFVIAGAILACGMPAGLYALLPASLVAFISGVLSAWNFLLPPPNML